MHSEQPIKIAVLAMGGEGGGVLADWIVALGEACAHIGQSTSIPGVAQRTGATIYYVELFPAPPPAAPRRLPVLALMPMPGDVDIVLASELMEAGRAVLRGLVTRERTTLLTSTHRVYSITEKSALGDGRLDSDRLLRQVRTAAKRLVCFDMAAAAESAGSLVSAVLFGALCGADVLPFARAAFEATIERGGVGVKQSLRAFDLGYRMVKERAAGTAREAATALAATDPGDSAARLAPAGRGGSTMPDDASSAVNGAPRSPAVAKLLARIDAEYPVSLRARLCDGIRRLIDYQDSGYANLYLDRLARVRAAGGNGADERVLGETARHLALWMSYEDSMRVADLKTRASRFERVRAEVRAEDTQVLHIAEFMHPRLEELCDSLPAPLGRWLARPHLAHRLLARLLRRGRVVRTSSLGGFLLLYLLACWRVGRPCTLRHAVETERIETWLKRIVAAARDDAAFAIAIAECQQLVKGYGDTHRRGWRNFQTLMQLIDRRPPTLTAATLAELRRASLADEQGRTLRRLLDRFGWQAGDPDAHR